jgi:outer membrane protein
MKNRGCVFQGGTKVAKKIISIVVVLVVLAALGVLGYFGYGYAKDRYFKKTEVGSLDRDVIFKLSEFMKANEKVNEKVAELNKQYEKLAKSAPKPEQQEELMLRFRQDVETLKANEIKPLLDKAQAAIAIIAIEKKMKVVLDKKIVVCGAVDITEEVKAKFKAPEEIKTPSENIGKDSKIGYFDQDVVRSIKMFRDTDKQIFDSFQRLKKDLEDQSRNLSDAEKEKLFNEYNTRFMKEREQKYVPLLKKVTKTVEEVARKKELNMVLDKQFVMYGGKNVTDEVVETLNSK